MQTLRDILQKGGNMVEEERQTYDELKSERDAYKAEIEALNQEFFGSIRAVYHE